MHNAMFDNLGELVLTSGRSSVKVWGRSDGHENVTIYEDRLYGATFSPDARLIAGILCCSKPGHGCYNRCAGHVKIWSGKDGLSVLDITTDVLPYRIAFAPDGRRLAAVCSNSLRYWDLIGDDATMHVIGKDNDAYYAWLSCAFSSCGRFVVMGDFDCYAEVWSIAGSRLVLRLGGVSHPAGQVNYASFSGDGSMIITASNACFADVWNFPGGELVRSLFGHAGSVNWASLSNVETQEFNIDGFSFAL